ncbi:DUF1559 domain-containing protein [Blastopirellula marina]|uniref:DUF1559 domain-containing protein n=1 Tax=Blastopirellula marina TaxID=124 RepID=A0A2S8FTG9_9BACT|nr:DUF1559 domain-containing protein [Blastopirellula marina]PQO35350.1 hypothetical protein C5Y98_13350 [Blastopirellula marina]PTL43990.1 DUF1559 domain-containing protein [Blastopirellula marina]
MSGIQDSAIETPSPWPRRCLLGAIVLLVAWLCFGMYALVEPRDASRFASSTNNLKQIGLAMHDYHDRYGMFPPAYVPDESGRPMHSWRVLILPFLEQQDLYDKYDFDEPWDGPNNLPLLTKLPQVYRDPRLASDDVSLTTYQVIAAPGTMFDPYAGPIRFPDLVDGTTETLLAIENLGRPVPWTKPVDMNMEDLLARVPLYNAPREIVPALMSDGSTRWITAKNYDQLPAAATRAGNDTPSAETPP